jgi:FAD/FMN-containing dehydrogenase
MSKPSKFDEPLDRRAFLAAAGATGVAAVAGCSGGGATASARAARTAAAARIAGAGSGTLAHAIKGKVIEHGASGFAAASHVYNERFDYVIPSAVAYPENSSDVSAAIKWATAHGVPIRARSGGHSYAGYSVLSNGVVLDLQNIRGVNVNHGGGTANIGAGAQLLDVYTALAAHGATIPAGSCPSVGVGGHLLGGGMGLAGRNFGLACDNIVGARIVTADGKIHDVDKHSNPDLLWALRGGGGGNFGVVTRFTMKLHKMPSSASYFFVSWPWSAASDAVEAWLGWAPNARDELTSILHLNAVDPPSLSVSGQYFGPESDLGSLLAPLRNAGGSVTSGQRGYLALQMLWAGCSTKSFAACHTLGTHPGGTFPRESFNAKSDYVSKQFSSAGRSALIHAVESRVGQPGSGALLFDSYGGAINRVAPGATAFVHRNDLACIQYLSYGGGNSWLQSAWSAMRPYVSGMAYQNYIDSSLTSWRQAYYGSNYARLKSIRKTVDPHHLFNFPQAIGR